MEAAEKVKRILGTGWQTFPARQVDDGATELEQVTNFAYAVRPLLLRVRPQAACWLASVDCLATLLEGTVADAATRYDPLRGEAKRA